MRTIRKVIVHHSASSPTTSPAVIARWHRERWPGAPHPGAQYHLVIHQSQDGVWLVSPQHPLSHILWHDSGENSDSVAVCLCGDYRGADPTPEAWRLLQAVLVWLLRQLGLEVEDVRGHREDEPAWTPTDCPGFEPEDLRRDLRALLNPVPVEHRTAPAP